jgi:hypothetical protein
MGLNRNLILIVLAILTFCFLGASYTLWFNPTGLPIVGAGSLLGEESTAPEVTSETDTVKLTIGESGIAAVSAGQLRKAGLSFSNLSSNDLILMRDGQPIPFLVKQDDEDEPMIYFYAVADGNPHEPPAVYELRQGAGISMPEREAQPFNAGESNANLKLVWEDDRLFVENGIPGDPWLGPILLAPDRWTLHLNTIQPDGGPANLVVRLFTNVETQDNERHHIEILVNSQVVAEHAWEGAGEETIRVPLQEGILLAGDQNSVSVVVYDDTAPQDEAIYIDSLELSYTGPINITNQAVRFTSTAPNVRVDGAGDGVLIFDITDPASPVALTSLRPDGESTHFSPGSRESDLIALNAEKAIKPGLETAVDWERSLRDPRRGADYIAIVADVPGFAEAIKPLIAHRKEQGFRVEAVPSEQIYDEFGFGQRDPQAIKDFIAYALKEWQPPAPQYVLLAGDATYDLKNQMVGKNRNRLPTQMLFSLQGGYVASDGWFSRDEDNTARVAIGRFPAQNAPQLRAMINKTIDYETDILQDAAEWTSKALLVADTGSEYEEEAADLAEFLEEDGYSVYQVNLDGDENARYKIISAMDEGVGIVHYAGSGSASAWSDQAVLQNSDIQVLQNGANLPIFNTFTCRNGSFANPRTDSLAESLLRDSQSGIVASVAPSGDIAEEYEKEITADFFELFVDQDIVRLGDTLLNMYNAAAGTPLLQEAMAPVNILGDPALLIGKPDNN